MLAITLRFPAGRYHATPWDRHVNEAAVAWPPEPLRLYRALIATWHRKLDAVRYPREQLQSLLGRLAEAGVPHLHLPEDAIHAHTRHYMPINGRNPALVFDAFARLSPDAPVVFGWPGLTLMQAEQDLLDALLAALGYFGRAESWVSARREAWPHGFNCLPTAADAPAVDPETGEVLGQVMRVLTPVTAARYTAVRAEHLQRLAAATPARSKSKSPADRPDLPEHWLDALAVDTATLQAAGWSLPPVAEPVAYRAQTGLQTLARRQALRPRMADGALPTAARFIVYGKPLPRAEAALRVGEALRSAAMGQAKRLLGDAKLVPEISGHDLPEGSRHAHAFWLPEPNSQGEIDHVLVHAPGGFSAAARQVLRALRHVHWGDGEPLRVMLEGVGQPVDFVQTRLLGASSVWRSVTPYLHPWYLKPRELRTPHDRQAAVLAQLQREWRTRGENLVPLLAAKDLSEVAFEGRKLQALHFARFRRKRGLTQPDTSGRLIELVFAAPLQGPLALGFGCHFGLGLFVPSDLGAEPL